MTKVQLQIADYLITKYQETGYTYKCIDDDAIEVFNDDGTKSIYRIIDGVVTECKQTES